GEHRRTTDTSSSRRAKLKRRELPQVWDRRQWPQASSASSENKMDKTHPSSEVSPHSWTREPRVLSLSFFQDRDVGVCVLPNVEEILVGCLCLVLISRQSKRSTELQIRQCTYRIRAHYAPMIKDLLKLGGGFRVLLGGQEGFAAHVRGVQTAKIIVIE